MKIQIKSDIHLEFKNFEITNENDSDVLILAGDILPSKDAHHGRYSKFLAKCSSLFTHVIYVAGNHEHYYSDINESIESLRTVCSGLGNVHYLENDVIIIDDIKFIGCTLWTNLNNDNQKAHRSATMGMLDYRVITKDGSVLTTVDTYKIFNESLAFIKAESSSHDKVIVVSHNAPSFGSLDPQYAGDPLNHAFISNLDDFIMSLPSIKMWCHGHVHTAFDYMIGNTRIVCNPRGYQSERWLEQTGWDEFKQVEIL